MGKCLEKSAAMSANGAINPGLALKSVTRTEGAFPPGKKVLDLESTTASLKAHNRRDVTRARLDGKGRGPKGGALAVSSVILACKTAC